RSYASNQLLLLRCRLQKRRPLRAKGSKLSDSRRRILESIVQASLARKWREGNRMVFDCSQGISWRNILYVIHIPQFVADVEQKGLVDGGKPQRQVRRGHSSRTRRRGRDRIWYPPPANMRTRIHPFPERWMRE